MKEQSSDGGDGDGDDAGDDGKDGNGDTLVVRHSAVHGLQSMFVAIVYLT